jgi:hypothetical protein
MSCLGAPPASGKCDVVDRRRVVTLSVIEPKPRAPPSRREKPTLLQRSALPPFGASAEVLDVPLVTCDLRLSQASGHVATIDAIDAIG